MPMSDPQFRQKAALFTADVAMLFDRTVHGLSVEQVDAMLGVLSGALGGLMKQRLGERATQERFIRLGEYYRQRRDDDLAKGGAACVH